MVLSSEERGVGVGVGIDYEGFKTYLSQLATTLFGGPATIEENEFLVQKFLATPNADTIFCAKKRDDEGIVICEDPKVVKALSSNVDHVLMIIKPAQISADIPFLTQLNIINLPLHINSETLRVAINFGLLPYYDIVSDESSSNLTTRKKFNELSSCLQQANAEITVSDLLLTTPSKIKDILAQKTSIDQVLEDTSFLNELTNTTNNWVKQIQAVTHLSHDPTDGESMADEVRFWGQMESALSLLNKQITSSEIQTSMEVLSRARRFHVTLSFENDTGINEMTKKTQQLNAFLRDLPINEMLGINNDPGFENFQRSVSHLFSHLKQKLGLLPLDRARRTVEVLLKEVVYKLQELMSKENLMSLPFQELLHCIDKSHEILNNIEANLKFMSNILRELSRKTKDKHKTTTTTINQSNLDSLRNKLASLTKFRKNHQDLLKNIEITFSGEEASDNAAKLIEAYNTNVLSANPISPSHEDTMIWTVCERAYMTIFNTIYANWTSKVNEYLNKAEYFTDYLQVFRRFSSYDESLSALSIPINDTQKMAILERAMSELQIIKEEANHSRVEKYNNGMSAIFLCLSLSSKVEFYRKGLEMVLGTEWKNYSIGLKIDAMSKNMLSTLNPNVAFHRWVAEELATTSYKIQNMGTVIDITKEEGGDMILSLNVNIAKLETFQYLSSLKSLGFTAPSSIVLESSKLNQLLPIAAAIDDQIQEINTLFRSTFSGPKGEIKLLFSKAHLKKLIALINKATKVKWIQLSQAASLLKSSEQLLINSESLVEIKSFKNFGEIQILLDHLYLQNCKIDNFMNLLDHCLHELKTAYFKNHDLEIILGKIQQKLQETTFEEEELTEKLVKVSNEKIAMILRNRLNDQLLLFLSSVSPGESIIVSEFDKYVKNFPPFEHHLSIQEGTLVITPTLVEGKCFVFNIVKEMIEIVSVLKMMSINSHSSSNYDVVSMLDYPPHANEMLNVVFSKIEMLYQEGNAYLDQWKILERLCEINFQDTMDIKALLNPHESVFEWFRTVKDVFLYGSLFDEEDSCKKFGQLFTITFKPILNKFATSFELLKKTLLQYFTSRLQEQISLTNTELMKSKTTLQSPLRFDAATPKIMANVEEVFVSRSKLTEWVALLSEYKSIETFLKKQRFFKFSSDWLYTENLENYLSMVTTLLDKKDLLIKENNEFIRSKLKVEAEKTVLSIEALQKNWEENKPTSGHLAPATAIESINAYQAQYSRLNTYLNTLSYLASQLQSSNSLVSTIRKPTSFMSDIENLKHVWSSVNVLWEELEAMKSITWSAVDTRHLGKRLGDLVKSARELPANIRQYAAVNEIQLQAKSCLKSQAKVAELSSDAMKPRHWRKLLAQLGSSKLFADLRVGDVWDLNLNLHSAIVDKILEQARDERTIEECLKDIQETWRQTALELFNFENKCRLVKNWESLLDKCEVDLNTIGAIRKSPYYSSFEKETWELENKLSSLYSILNVWIDVQREWVELEGVFGNENSDIKIILPTEHSRFSNLTFELLSLLKRIYRYDQVIDIILIQDIHSTLTKHLETLTKISKSLADYLERQRDLFPRFFFLGNDDLLEMIGASKEFSGVNKHLKKMFAGVEKVEIDSASNSLINVQSSEGEVLNLINPIPLNKYPLLHEWLTKLEMDIQLTLAHHVDSNITSWKPLITDNDPTQVLDVIVRLPGQVLNILTQVTFTSLYEDALESANEIDVVNNIRQLCESMIKTLVELLRVSNSVLEQKKIRNLIIEILHQRNIADTIQSAPSSLERRQKWYLQQRFYHDPSELSSLRRLLVKQVNSEHYYGYEYLGNPDKLAYTPLIDDCFIVMTQALSNKQGGSPFGPAGTGKTESIKALGQNLGKMVIVFCCDERFDFRSISRLLLGLCRIGAWGCFDEFNRLEDYTLSAVSSLIGTIEEGLKNRNKLIHLSDRETSLNFETGLFITMNPGYTARTELPENLKKLFRSFAMTKPDIENIIEVLLTSRTFKHSKELSKIIKNVFEALEKKTSNQKHYDFGLRAIKSVINRCGQVIHDTRLHEKHDDGGNEFQIILQCMDDLVSPRLTTSDRRAYEQVKIEHFPNIGSSQGDEVELKNVLKMYCEDNGFARGSELFDKAMQLAKVQSAHHGIMLVGESGTGKTTVLEMVLSALKQVENVDHYSVVISPKVMSKDQLYGKYDKLTKLWTDGLFTSILRKIDENSRGELQKRIWIVFEGEIDPVWAENLNSVLDDNRILTLPTGERLVLPSNVRIVFETTNLNNATLATISRCGMVWFDEQLVKPHSLYFKLIHDIKVYINTTNNNDNMEHYYDRHHRHMPPTSYGNIEHQIQDIITLPLLEDSHQMSQKASHIMKYSFQRSIESFKAFFKTHLKKLFNLSETTLSLVDVRSYIGKAVASSLIWAFTGDSPTKDRLMFEKFLRERNALLFVDFPKASILDFEIGLPEGDWISLESKVGDVVDLETHQISDPNLIIPTVDTIKHEYLMYSILDAHKPLLLCGPPGSGKTMTLLKALGSTPDLDLLCLNFSKESTVPSIITSLENFCVYKRINGKMSLCPRVNGKWVVVFCDEVNLPKTDRFGTQTVIALLKQLIEYNGFWQTKDMQWVSLQNIQFVAACNPPTDSGRYELSNNFLRRVCLIMVDYPEQNSLVRIYQTFNDAVLKLCPNLKAYSVDITRASVDVYEQSKKKFTPLSQSHYVYSPRELTRWSRGLLEALKQCAYNDLPDLLRLWFHEGLRLFFDRLCCEEERTWTIQLFHNVAKNCFPNVDFHTCFRLPVLYSDWMSLGYQSVNEKELKMFVHERLRVYMEEDTGAKLVLHSEMLDHILRIDRVLKQPQGHMILIGPSTSGKTTLSKFVAWINGLKTEQLMVRRNYTLDDFDEFLRNLLLRCLEGEKICLLIDESSIIEASFIERMNTLLANAEVPGLFEGDNHVSLMDKCLEKSQLQGLLLDTDVELYRWFTEQLSRNLHVIFTMNDSTRGVSQKVISSPALFNRCVLNWMGDWTNDCLHQIAMTELNSIPIVNQGYKDTSKEYRDAGVGLASTIARTMVRIHKGVALDEHVVGLRQVFPAQFLTFLRTFSQLCFQKQVEVDERQRHLILGYDKLKETVIQVDRMKSDLKNKEILLRNKNQEARATLNKMLVDQNEAERKQEFSVEMQVELEKQEREINQRKEKVLRDLQYAEPAVIEAQRGVQNIKKQHLTEIRSMSNPPKAVKVTMESVCILLGYQVSGWKDVQLAVRSDDFISNIVTFDCEVQLSSELREYMEAVYLARDDFTYEIVHRASKACGPLLEWVRAQLEYSKILKQVGPLRDEVRLLEQKSLKTKAQLIAIDQMIKELEEKIEDYKIEYSELIRETEKIKMESVEVERRVNRSTSLIQSLANEKARWKASIECFDKQNDEVVGSALYAAAFVTYAGSFDEKGRSKIQSFWKEQIKQSAISFDENFAISHYLMEPMEIKNYVSNGLIDDDLSKNNVALMQWAKIPILIDPTGTMADIIAKTCSEKMITVTSFLSEGFIDSLENSMRFGGLFIIEDCENYDPIIDDVLRSEVQKTGGRLTVRLGDHFTDFNSKFKLIMCTKQAQLNLSDFVLSRTSVVNFSITVSSLENIALDLALQESNPKLQKQRSDLILANGENRLRLQELEKKLLECLSSTSQGILENDDLLKSLEMLNVESQELNRKLSSADEIISKVEKTREQFAESAKQCTAIFAKAMQLKKVSKFYGLSVSLFSSVFSKVIKGVSSDAIIGILSKFCQELYDVFSVSLRYEDKIVFGALIMITAHSERFGALYNSAIKSLLSCVYHQPSTLNIDSIKLPLSFGQDQDEELSKILFPLINILQKKNPDLLGFFDKLTSETRAFAVTYSSRYHQLSHWVKEEKHTTSSVFIVTTCDDFDATFKFTTYAEAENISCSVISMGSTESSALVNNELTSAGQSAKWVILQNVQMAPLWLAQLDATIDKLQLHPDSKVFLTCNTRSRISDNLINHSKVLHFENDSSFRGALLETFLSIPSTFLHNAIHLHIFLLFTWFHKQVLETLRYTPFTFEKSYDISEADFMCGISQIHKILASTKNDVDQIPWLVLRFLIGDIIYGGKFDNEKDKQKIRNLVNRLFDASSLESDFNIIQNELTEASKEILHLPEGISLEVYTQWIETLPEIIPLSWLGLKPELGKARNDVLANGVTTKIADLLEIPLEDDDV
ncbi:DYN1 [Candida oxycetoniae]|uniref:Dynein heavy chain, cytoplasmic n=1 Tax=Candida oxycetoniae TaxID=497107 RepID=A0AAI9SX14_9ASCO|nr:DYN1 [Candida oxycetoniae]KAI3404296.2 DYN1 [Candida oxycetoniae]